MADTWINCASCKTRTNIADFTVKKDKRNKSCKTCCAKAAAYVNSKKCEHGRQKSNCADCDGVGICEHGRRTSRCAQCGGSQICDHKLQRAQCKKCTDPQKVLIENWLGHCKESDKKRKQETNITRDYCAHLITESGKKCCYCAVELQLLERTANMMTIERIDNRLGHVIGNCRIACFHCNCTKAGN